MSTSTEPMVGRTVYVNMADEGGIIPVIILDKFRSCCGGNCNTDYYLVQTLKPEPDGTGFKVGNISPSSILSIK